MAMALGVVAALALPAGTAAKPKPDRVAAQKNAAKACKTERAAIGAQAFADKYKANKNGRNAFGKCVSSRTREA